MPKTVLVSGCYDLLHSGHVEFFRQASAYGELHVALGSDATITALKGRPPVNNEQERLFMVRSIVFVTEVFISSGSGMLDFEPELRQLNPDYLVVNQDGDQQEKRRLCAELGITYVVLQRTPFADLPARSTTDLRQADRMPFRIDLAGGWLDQPFVSRLHPGSVLTVSLEPTHPFNERSGMASSTRRTAIELWGSRLPPGDPERTARTLFCCDNPPGTQEVSGSQDAIGISFPGLANAYYEGEYWPSHIEHVLEPAMLRFVQDALYLVPLSPRRQGFKVLADTNLTPAGARALADSARGCWQAILARDIERFGHFFRLSFEAQVAMFPHMLIPAVTRQIERYRSRAHGWKLSGAGGGGYLILIASEPIEGALRITVRSGS